MEFKNKLKHLCGEDNILYGESIFVRAIAMFSALVLTASVIFGLLPTDEDIDIYDKILRLHVIANSDSETDQSLKLAVRDTILSNSDIRRSPPPCRNLQLSACDYRRRNRTQLVVCSFSRPLYKLSSGTK